jgi:Zn-dependent protease with chaperone function
LNFILERLDAEYLSLVVFIILAVVFSLAIQFFTVIMTYKMKRNLVITARESVNNEIITKLHSYEPKSDLIKEYRFADIEVQTLFLSAGVTSFGYSNNICLVSRYFQWKLSEEELLSVLLHEVGHIFNHHLVRSYQILGLEFILRTLRIFAIFSGIALLREYGSLLNVPSVFSITFLIFCVLTFGSSTLLFFIKYYRSFLAEIESDYFSGSRIGFQLLADTLRKLPSFIPSPIGYNQSSFLGFRVALLRDYEKNSTNSF